MYRFTSEADFDFLIGATVTQIVSGKFDLQVAFDSGAKLCIQGPVELSRDGLELAEWSIGSGLTTVAFQELLGARVANTRVVNPRELEIRFH